MSAHTPLNSSLPVGSDNAAKDANRPYEAFHAPRFAFLLGLLGRTIQSSEARVLDIGMSELTSQITRQFSCPVDSLGLEPDVDLPRGRHYCFDLNDAQEKRRWRTDLGPYDVIVFAEVMEHLYTAPELVLAYLHSLLNPVGSLIIQTPNAASLRKRLKLLVGWNPYERIRPDRSNPGHFREYTSAELRRILNEGGFAVESLWTKFYFDARYARHDTGREEPELFTGALKNVLYRLIPGGLQEGITVIAKKLG